MKHLNVFLFEIRKIKVVKTGTCTTDKLHRRIFSQQIAINKSFAANDQPVITSMDLFYLIACNGRLIIDLPTDLLQHAENTFMHRINNQTNRCGHYKII